MPVVIPPRTTLRPSDKVTFPPTTSPSKTQGTGMKHAELRSGKMHFRRISCSPGVQGRGGGGAYETYGACRKFRMSNLGLA